MGGNAIKGCHRLPRYEYFKLFDEVAPRLNAALMGASYRLIQAYYEKESFGDMDLIVNSDHLPHDWKQRIIDEFQPTGTYSGSAFSFDYKNFQIDLIPTKSADMNFAQNYFDWNDMGNLIGRISRVLDLKYGHDGLWYILRDPECDTRQVAEICLTKDSYVALNFLQLDYNRFMKGFANRQEIFDFVASSGYFSKDLYPLEHRSNRARTRDKKRETYTEFLKWLDSTQPADNHVPNKDKSTYLPLIESRFPEFAAERKRLLEELAETKRFKSYWNGDIVSELTNLEGKPLSHFMGDMIKHFDGKEKFRELILILGDKGYEKTIHNIILDIYAKKGESYK